MAFARQLALDEVDGSALDAGAADVNAENVHARTNARWNPALWAVPGSGPDAIRSPKGLMEEPGIRSDWGP
ncbi:hypothetical protein Acsp03_31670 [Actinomadura sp. NBRC 104412]|nr:hypothetical protein Acsp03_31670 [Actinomadura sp. NBRC 104412]